MFLLSLESWNNFSIVQEFTHVWFSVAKVNQFWIPKPIIHQEVISSFLSFHSISRIELHQSSYYAMNFARCSCSW